MDHIAGEQRRYYLTSMEGEPWYRRGFYAMLCFFSVLWSEINAFKLFTRASSGTYTTMLALIPFVVVGGSLILTFNKEASVPTLVEKIHELVIPVAGDTIATFLGESLSRTLDLGLGPVGLISLLVTSVMLFVHIEDCFNDIWHVTRARAFYLRILLFYAIVTLGPLLFSFSIYQATQIFSDDYLSGVVGPVVWKIVRETLILAGLCFISFKFLPNTRVNFKSACIPAVMAAVNLEIFKFGFSFYLTVAFSNTSNYSILYGAIGIIPITLLWFYISWVILLIAVESGYCMQNLRSLLLRKFYDTQGENAWVFLGPYAPVEVLGALVRHLCDGMSPPTADELSQECVYPAQAVEAIMAKLEKLNVVRIVEGEFSKSYIIARPLDRIILQEVMAAFDESSIRSHKYPKLDALLAQLRGAQNFIWGNQNANALREDGVCFEDVSEKPTLSLHIAEEPPRR